MTDAITDLDRAALAALTGGVLDEEVDSPRIAVALLPNGHRVVVRGGNGDPQVEIVEAFSLRVLAAIELPAAGDHRPLRDWIKASVKALGGGQ